MPANTTTGAPGSLNSLNPSEMPRERVQITLRGSGSCPRETRALRSEGTGNPMVMVSAATVVALARTASPSERISRSRFLSAGEEKSEGVRLRVEIRASQVRAKLAITRGLGRPVPVVERFC